jgi:hypothetical protein
MAMFLSGKYVSYTLVFFMLVHLLQYVFTVYICTEQTAFLQYNETKFIKLDECLNICTATSLKYFIDIFKQLVQWALYNKWQVFIINFMLITIYAIINRTSDA